MKKEIAVFEKVLEELRTLVKIEVVKVAEKVEEDEE